MEKTEKNNLTIFLNILDAKKEKVSPAYVSKHNSNREKQVILSMVTNGEEWHHVAVKKLSALIIEITSKHEGDFYCLYCLHSFRTKNSESLKKVCEKY